MCTWSLRLFIGCGIKHYNLITHGFGAVLPIEFLTALSETHKEGKSWQIDAVTPGSTS